MRKAPVTPVNCTGPAAVVAFGKMTPPVVTVLVRVMSGLKARENSAALPASV